MDIWYPCFMQKPFVTQAELFVSSSDLEHPALHALDDTEAVLDWSKIEPILSSIYASQTGRPSYPLLTLFRGTSFGSVVSVVGCSTVAMPLSRLAVS